MAIRAIPNHVLEDEAFCRRLIVAVSEAVARSMDESDWKKFAVLYGLESMTVDRHRFLRSLSFSDPDHEGMVLDLINHVFPDNPEAFLYLFGRHLVQERLKKDVPDIVKFWSGGDDPLIEAISHSVSEVQAVRGVIDLEQHTKRIQAALPGDPHQAIGHTKDMLEATMKTIMDRRGKPFAKDVDFPAITTRCMTELGLIGTTPPASEEEKYIRKIASAAKTMIETANEYRNLAGTGHGRVVGKEGRVTPADASLVASSGLILAAWLLRRLAEIE